MCRAGHSTRRGNLRDAREVTPNAAIIKATNLDDGSGVSLKVFVDGVYKETLAPGETYKEFVDKDQSYFIEMTLINDSVVCSGSTPTLGECIEYSVEC